VSTEQQETLDAILRRSAFPVGSDVSAAPSDIALAGDAGGSRSPRIP
jgi:hypothetical protein